MKMNRKESMNRENKIRIFMVIAACFLSVKYIFVDFGIDAGFQVSMSYRLATGDIMFKEMWEPYQMSAFLCAFFIKLYLSIFRTTTGIVLYLQLIGVLVDGAIAYLLYRTVSKYFGNKNVAFAMAWVFFLVSPKDVPLPEYANMQIWFSMLLCITFYIHYKNGKNRWLVLSALCLCATILSYPSCIILFFGMIILLLFQGKKKEVLIFGGTCFLAGAAYLCFIFRQVSVSEFFAVLKNMIALETSHTAGVGEKIIGQISEVFRITVTFCVTYGISYAIIRVVNRKKNSEQDREVCRVLTDLLFCGIILLISLCTVFLGRTYNRFSYSISFLGIILIGMRHRKKLSADKYYFYLCGTVISVLQFAATLLLSNVELIASVPYLLIGVIAAFLPIAEALESTDTDDALKTIKKVVLFSSVIILMFRNAYIFRPLWGHVNNIFEVRGIVKEGPALGIISEYMGPYIQNETIKEWEQYIEDGDSIYLIGGSLDTLGYLYADTVIAAPSLVPTPGYNESILEYWEMNPDKYPDVIIASCWYGTMNASLHEDSWIMNWIEEEYKPQNVVDGKYWRYYFKER